jgi:broad specificity phosphatase PhoE
MKVYFVRHGQSIFHGESIVAEKKHQLPDTPLSETGMRDVAALAKRFNSIPLDLILTSTYKRAIQTAQAIEKNKPGIPFIQTDLLIERKMPTSFLGKPIDDPAIVPIHEEIRKHFYEPGWHYADEENAIDLLSRAKTATEYILSQKKENIVVATHGYFLTVLIFYLIFGEKIDPHLFRFFRDHTANTTASLTICDYQQGIWKLITWNDYVHLGTEMCI